MSIKPQSKLSWPSLWPINPHHLPKFLPSPTIQIIQILLPFHIVPAIHIHYYLPSVDSDNFIYSQPPSTKYLGLSFLMLFNKHFS